jgi:MYXO-CTERM domain-containing protein
VQAWGSWGGNDDDIFDQPVTQISLQIDADKGTKGTVRFDDVRVEIEDGSEVRLTGFEQNKWPISIINNSFITNHGLNDGGAILAADVSAEFRNNLVVSTGGGQALSLLDSLSQGDWSVEYNGFFENPGGDLPLGMEGSWNVEGDPGFAQYNQDGTLEMDRFVFLQGSPYRDAGDPSLLDPDGSPSDLGANGGPLAQWVDVDEDGYSTSDDCDDGDASVHPGAEEVFYDGVNQDCTMGSDFDADGDGAEALEYGGEDCDDNDAKAQLNCSEEDSGDPSNEPRDPGDGCSCSVQSGRALSPWAFISLAALFWRRRKRT